MDLRQLRYFKVLATHQHFGRAAAVLAIAQPALSRQIQLLETELGVRLVERHPRGASLTPEGELLLDRASFLLRYSDQVKIDIKDLQGAPRGPVVLGLPPSLTTLFGLPLGQRISERYPEIRLRLTERFWPGLPDALQQGLVDLAVLSGHHEPTALVHTKALVSEQICVIGPLGDPRLEVESFDIRRLRNIPLILTGQPNAGVGLALERAAARADVVFDERMTVESALVAAEIVSAGLGWMIHFAAAVRREIDAGLLRAVPITGLSLDRQLAYAVQRPPSRATTALISLISEITEDLVTAGRWPGASLPRPVCIEAPFIV